MPKSKELVRVRLDLTRKRIDRSERYLKSTKAAVELGAGLSYRIRESVGYGYDTSLRYNAGAGLRLPKPFLWGLEFAGHAARPIGGGSSIEASYIRMFLEYTL